MKTFFILAFSLAVATGAAAQALTPLAKLNRLSRVLRGHAPSEAEREALQHAVEVQQVENFLNQKTDEYLGSEEHAFKMNVRLEELFRLKSTAAYSADGFKESDTILYERRNALNSLFTDLGRRNLSWDALLTGKSYHLTDVPRIDGFGVSDFGFLAALVPNLKSSTGLYSPEPGPQTTADVSFSADDPRIAGAITTSRFFNRFVNTGLNKNRKRAAAIFRIFLCDSMSAAVSSSDGQDSQILDLMFPHNESMTEDELRSMAQQGDALHGTRPDCMACHSKLDPMGRTLMTSALVLSPLAAPGRLHYKRGQDVVDIPARGIGDLGAAIARQPEYVSCQVRHFWNWFIDPKHAATPAKIQALSQEFERVGRRTNDFVKVLVRQPEFFAVTPPLTPDEIRARQVKAFLSKCQDCHKDQTYDVSPDGHFPDFTQWPIGGSKAEMKSWIDGISRKMDLGHDGETPRMPPTEAAWRTSYKEVQMIKRWISLGAPDEKGERMIEP